MIAKRKSRLAYLVGSLVLVFFLIARGDTGIEPYGSSEPNIIELNFQDPPFNLRGVDARFARDVPYGPYERNVFDIFLVDAAGPTPLVIYIHGGSFKTGDNGEIYLTNRDEIRKLLHNGVSFATINYRLLEECDDEGVIKPLSDSRRCLQFLRYHHEQLNIDPSRVAVYGTSAGAGTSLWLAFSDDMADPNADDPILCESTRVTAAVARATQATYDLLKWETVVFTCLGLTLEDMGELMGLTGEMGCVAFYGADSLEQLGTPEFQAYRASVDMLALMSPDDPPIWVRNNIENVGIPTEESELMHHCLHAVAVAERAEEVGVECMLYIPPLHVADPSGDDVVEFLLKQFGLEDPNAIGQDIETPGLVTYMDADQSNTTNADGTPFAPTGPSGSPGAVDDMWHAYTGYGNSGSVYLAGDSGTENTPMLKTTISGLADGTYDVFAYFWSDPVQNWGVRGGFTSSDLFCFNRQSAQRAESSQFCGSVDVLSGGLALYRAYIGRKQVSGAASISAYIDDYDISFANRPARTVYDGIGVAHVIPKYAGDLNRDGKVDLSDIAILGQGWLMVYDTHTLTDIADNWLIGI